MEIKNLVSQDCLWLRGGFPGSLLASSEHVSQEWRLSFVRTYVERELTALEKQLGPTSILRLWTMLAHRHGAMTNLSELSRSLGISSRTLSHLVDIFESLFLIRRLPAYHANLSKRIIKTPKLFIRDSGLLHTLLRIDTLDSLAAHPSLGTSFEGFVIEQILPKLPWLARGYCFRSRAGAEIDLLIEWNPSELWAIEVKRYSFKVERGFHEACKDLNVSRRFLIHGGDDEPFPIRNHVEVLSLADFIELMKSHRPHS